MPFGTSSTYSMPTMGFGVTNVSAPWQDNSQQIKALQASKGGKLLAPDEFYKHPVRNIFGSYSTYVQWFEGGKQRRAQEQDEYQSAISGTWQPSSVAPGIAGSGAPIKVGMTPGARTDMAGRRTEGVLAGIPTKLGERMPRLTRDELLALDAERAPLMQAAESEYKRRVSAETMRALPPEEQARIDVENKRLAQRRFELAEKESERKQADMERKSKQFETTWENRFKLREAIHENAKDLLGIKAKYDIAKAQMQAAEAAKLYAKNLSVSKEYADTEYKRALADKRADIARATGEKAKAQIKGAMLELGKMRFNHDLKRISDMRKDGNNVGATYALKQAEDDYRQAIEMATGAEIPEAAPVSAPAPVAPAPMMQAEPQAFNSIEEAEAANLPPGTMIVVNGRRAIIE